MDWLHETASAIASRTGVDVDALIPPAKVQRALLDIARVAAHASGERTNAPLLCYVLGRAVEHGVNLEDVTAVIGEA